MLDSTHADLRAEQSWYALADIAGIDDSRCSVFSFRVKDEPESRSVVLQIARDGVPVYALKQMLAPAGVPPVSRWANAANAAHGGLDGSNDAAAEALAWSDMDQAILSEWIQGTTAEDRLLSSRLDDAARAQVLRRAGAWLARYHRLTLVANTTFNPAFLRSVSVGLRADLNNRALDVPRPGWFRRFARYFEASADHLAGAPTHSAIAHGNFRPANLVIDGARATGIGFRSPNKTTTITQDVAQFLVHYAAMTVPAGAMRGGRIMPHADLAAFFDGYDLLDPFDPVLSFMIDAKILIDWSNIPVRFDERSVARHQKLQGIKQMVKSRMGEA